MSLLKANSVQIGQSATATQNFTLSVPSSPDGTIKLARGNSGATTADVLSVNASGAITGATISGSTINSSTLNGGSITSGTAVASTSGTVIDFTGIPSWAKRITVLLNGVSTNGASLLNIQIGSGSIQTSGYSGYYWLAGSLRGLFSSAFIIVGQSAASSINYGSVTLSLIGSNTWVETGIVADSIYALASTQSCGSTALSGSLDRIRLTTANGTDTFDAGSVNIMYEG
jgi:hypothetical protein